jgi:hypothetical protein
MQLVAAAVDLPKTSLQNAVQPLAPLPFANATLLRARLPNVPAITPLSTLRRLTPPPASAIDRATSSSFGEPPIAFSFV